MKSSKWRFVARFGVIIFIIALFINVLTLCLEVRRDLIYNSRCYGLSVMNDHFDNGEYYEIYLCTLRNRYADEQPEIDVSEFEAFGRFYEAYRLAKIYDDNAVYLNKMAEEKSKVTLKKILKVMDGFEKEVKERN